MLQARMDDMLREGKYTPDELQAALHNLRQSEAELGAVVEANKVRRGVCLRVTITL
jgi:hypothetical protein